MNSEVLHKWLLATEKEKNYSLITASSLWFEEKRTTSAISEQTTEAGDNKQKLSLQQTVFPPLFGAFCWTIWGPEYRAHILVFYP